MAAFSSPPFLPLIFMLEVNNNKMPSRKLIFTTYDHMEANVVKSFLESHEILVFKGDENISLMQPFSRIVFGGIKLYVPDDQEQKAKEFLDDKLKSQGNSYCQTGKLTQFTNPKAKFLFRVFLVILVLYFIAQIIVYLRK